MKLQQILDALKKLFGLSERPLPQSWLIDEEKVDEKDAWFEAVFGVAEFSGYESKDWRSLMPKEEIQKFGDCVSFSRTNVAESKAKNDGSVDTESNEWNFSDLDLAVGSGTTQQGNGLKPVAEYFRTKGISLEKDCLYTNDWNQRQINFNAAKNKLKYKGGNWQWVSPNHNSLKQALEASPIQIGIGVGSNWYGEGIIKDPLTYGTYHAILLCYIDPEGNYHIFDSYPPHHKTLDKDYSIKFAMSFKDLPENWRGVNVMDELFYKRMVGKLILRVEANGELYRVNETHLRKVNFNITDKQLFDDTTNEYWRPKKKFLGITEADFKRLETQAFLMEGILPPETNQDIKGLIN